MNNSSRNRSLVIVLLAVVILAFTFFTFNHATSAGSSHYQLFTYLAGAVVSIFIYSLVHELGHVIFGKLSGYKIEVFSVLGHAYIKTDSGYVVKRLSVPGAMGATIMRPQNESGSKYVLFVMGGSILTLIVALIFTIAGWLTLNTQVGLFLCGMAVVGYVITIINTVPMKEKGLYNDGLVLKLFRDDERAFELFNRLQTITITILKGGSITDVPEDVFKIPESYGMVPFAAELRLNKAEYLLHKDQIDEAEEELKEVIRTSEDNSMVHDSAVCFFLLSDNEKVEETYRENKKKITVLSNYYPTAKCALIVCKIKFDHEPVDKEVNEYCRMVKRQGLESKFETNLLKNILQEYGMEHLMQ